MSGNPRWKGLTIGMIPSHTSGLCKFCINFVYKHMYYIYDSKLSAKTLSYIVDNNHTYITLFDGYTSGACTYHLFYNAPELNWLVALQAFLTVFGNSTMALAAYRIYQWEKEQGWYSARGTEMEQQAAMNRMNMQRDAVEMGILLEKEKGSISSSGIVEEGNGVTTLDESSNQSFALKMFTTSLVLSLIVKYGELFLDAPFAIGQMSQVAALCIFLPTLLNISKWAIRSKNPESTFLSIF